jgi:hypothetical protein
VHQTCTEKRRKMKRILKLITLLVVGYSLRVAHIEVANVYLAYKYIECLKPVGADAFTLMACDSLVSKANEALIWSITPSDIAKGWAQPQLLELVEQSRNR